MANSSSRNTVEHRYGPAGFVATLFTILATEFAAWATAVPYVIVVIIYVLPCLLAIDVIVYVFLAKRRGTSGQVGRGILFGSLAVPVALIVFAAGFSIAHAIGPI